MEIKETTTGKSVNPYRVILTSAGDYACTGGHLGERTVIASVPVAWRKPTLLGLTVCRRHLTTLFSYLFSNCCQRYAEISPDLCGWIGKRRSYAHLHHLTNEQLAVYSIQEWWNRAHGVPLTARNAAGLITRHVETNLRGSTIVH